MIRRRLALPTLLLAVFVTMLDNTIVSVALYPIQDELQFGVAGLQWVLSAYTVALAALLLSGGALGDVVGRRRLFVAGAVIAALGSALSAEAPGLSWLLVGRAVQGVGAAGLLPATLAVVAAGRGDRRRGAAIGAWSAVGLLALALGPVIGGVLVDGHGWRAIFWLNVAVFGLLAVAAPLTVAESRDMTGRLVDLPGQLLTAVALGALTWATIEGHDRGWSSTGILAGYVAGAAALAALVVVESRSGRPLLDPTLFTDRTFLGANVAGFAVSLALFAVFFFLSLHLQLVRGLSPTDTALRFLPMSAVLVVTALLAGRLPARVPARLLVPGGLALAGVGMLALLPALRRDASLTTLTETLVLIGFGGGLATTPATTAVMGAAPSRLAGTAAATANTVREVGGVVGVAALGAVVSAQLSAQLTARIQTLPVPSFLRGTLRSYVVTQITEGHTHSLTSLYPGVIDAAKTAYVIGLRQAMLAAAIVLFVAGAVAALTLRAQPALAECTTSTSRVSTSGSVSGNTP